MTQNEYILTLCNDNPNAVIIGSLGTICYDLDRIEHPNKILIRGAMGSVIGIGLGYALNTHKQVIVLIGEGSFLMKMGSLATILKYQPQNLRVIIINNSSFASCGGQQNNFYEVSRLLKQVSNFEIFSPTL